MNCPHRTFPTTKELRFPQFRGIREAKQEKPKKKKPLVTSLSSYRQVACSPTTITVVFLRDGKLGQASS